MRPAQRKSLSSVSVTWTTVDVLWCTAATECGSQLKLINAFREHNGVGLRAYGERVCAMCAGRVLIVDICAKFMTQHFSILSILLRRMPTKKIGRKIVVWLVRTATGHEKPKTELCPISYTRNTTKRWITHKFWMFRRKPLVALRCALLIERGMQPQRSLAPHCRLADEPNWFD